MRDKERIAKLLHLIYRIWKKEPDLRLMQLLSNPFKIEEPLFYMEDDELEARLKKFYGDLAEF